MGLEPPREPLGAVPGERSDSRPGVAGPLVQKPLVPTRRDDEHEATGWNRQGDQSGDRAHDRRDVEGSKEARGPAALDSDSETEQRERDRRTLPHEGPPMDVERFGVGSHGTVCPEPVGTAPG